MDHRVVIVLALSIIQPNVHFVYSGIFDMPDKTEMQKMAKEFYEKEIRWCHERKDIECLDLPGNCFVDGFSSFKDFKTKFNCICTVLP